MSTFELLRALIPGAILLLLPGAFLLRALAPRLDARPEERPAIWFVLTLAVLAPAAIASILQPLSIKLVFGWWFVVTATAAAGAGLRGGTLRIRASARRYGEERVGVTLAVAAILTTAALAYGAFCFTRGGSIDRWWYLAFVRSWLASGEISAIDPMLGTNTFLARFAGNAWLTAMTAWARVGGVEPFAIYERVAPLLLAPLAISAAHFATRTVLGSRRLAVGGCIIAALYWTSGGMFPALTRLPEDKLVAAIIIAPVLWALIVSVVDADARVETSRLATHTIIVAATALALASVHPLVYGVTLPTMAPALLRARLRVAVVLGLVLAVTAALPVMLGRSALEHVAEGEAISAVDHPVGRIHLARDRVREVGDDIQVSPRVLARPLTVIAVVAGLAIALGRRRERVLLALPTTIALAICFVPPLAATAARVVGPWMVYRFLWAIPFVPLLVLVMEFAARWTRVGIGLPLAAAALLAAPSIGASIRQQAGPARTELATPTTGSIPALAAALRELPSGSLIAAAPELSERIPGLSARRVLAASDRATIVFAESREIAEHRLQSRAAVLAGLWRPTDGAPTPTHVVFAPGAPASRYCAREIFATMTHILCEFAARDPLPGLRLYEADARVGDTETDPRLGFLAASDDAVEGRVECTPDFVFGTGIVIFPRPGPWSARVPAGVCTFRAEASANADSNGETTFRPQALELNLSTGYADEEITIVATGTRAGSQRWSLRTRQRLRDGDALRYSLPRGEVDRVDVSLFPSYLPFIKARSFSVVLEPLEAPEASPR